VAVGGGAVMVEDAVWVGFSGESNDDRPGARSSVVYGFECF
jgi:hypothetical protein